MPFVCLNNCHTCATSMPVDYQVCASWLPFMYLFDCHMWACCGPGQLPHMGQFCACSLPCMCLLIAIYVPVDCHTGASCLPYRCLVSATCGPHVGQTTATRGPHVGQRCKTRVAHMCALGGSNFNCHMWALCGPLVECLLGRFLNGVWSIEVCFMTY